MDSDAERMRRYRAHKSGNHSLCKPDRECKLAETANMAVADDAEIPIVLTRGQQLYEDLKDGLGPETLALLEEASRMADRLDRLHAILNGKRREWMHFRAREDGDVNVILTGALAESRQQAATFAGLIRDIRAAKNAGNTGGKPKPAEKNTGGISGLADELAVRRSAS